MTDVEARPSAKQVTPARWDRPVSYVVWVFLFLVFALPALVVAYETAMHFSGPALDGPFQLYNTLRRIEAGQRPGVDFQFFHGIGMPYLHYWIYRALGGELRGSELARELIATASYPLVCLVFFRVFAGDWRRAFALTAGAMAASFALKMAAVLFAINGMLGLRAAIPTLIPVVLFLSPTVRVRTIAAGVAIGVALFLSTEQGLAAVMAYTIVSALAIVRRSGRRQQILETATTLAIAVVVLMVCLASVGGIAGMRGALRYNFRLVPMDQYWFFGAPPNNFVPSWRAGFLMLFQAPTIGAAVFLGAVATAVYLVRLWREPEGEPGRRNFALAYLPAYGLISCASLLGVFTGAYTQPCWRVLLLIGLIEATRLSERADARAGRRGILGVPRFVALAVAFICVAAAATIPIIPVTLTTTLPHVIADHAAGSARFAPDETWAVTLRDAQRQIDTHRGPRGELPTLWSTYAGWIEARNGMFHPSFDYIIHALGPENRTAYVETFRARRPTLVQTVLPTYTQYEAWLENNDWAFYDELLDWYTVSDTTAWSIFWERRSSRAPPPAAFAAMQVPAGLASVPLPPIPDSLASPIMLLEIDVEYDIHNPLQGLPIIGPTPRYLIGVEGAISHVPISLNPFVRHTRFPLLVARGKSASLHFLTYSLLPAASWTPRSLRVSVRPMDPRNERWLSNLVAHLTKE